MNHTTSVDTNDGSGAIESGDTEPAGAAHAAYDLSERNWDAAFEPPGTWYGDLSPMPAYLAVRFQSEPLASVMTERTRRHDAPIFKAHFGRRLIMVTDHRSLSYVLGSPATVFERPPEPLLGSARQHRARREFTKGLVAMRRADFESVLREVTDRALAHWRSRGEFELHSSLADYCSELIWQWLFAVIPPTGEEIAAWSASLAPLRADSALANALLRRIRPAPGSNQNEWAAEQCRRIASSPRFPEYVALAKRHGVSERDLPTWLLATAALNAVATPLARLSPMIVAIYNSPRVSATLRAEVSGSAGSMAQLAELPYLHAVFLETCRLWPTPQVSYRTACRDLVIPTHKLARRYRIRTGQTVALVHGLAMRDSAVFRDPDLFYPERFIDEPDLGGAVYPYRRITVPDSDRGCVAHGGDIGVWIIKYLIVRLFGEFGFRLAPKGARTAADPGARMIRQSIPNRSDVRALWTAMRELLAAKPERFIEPPDLRVVNVQRTSETTGCGSARSDT